MLGRLTAWPWGPSLCSGTDRPVRLASINMALATSTAVLTASIALLAPGPATAVPGDRRPGGASTTSGGDLRELPLGTQSGKPLKLDARSLSQARKRLSADRRRQAPPPPTVGSVRPWLAYDDVAGVDYVKNYTLRATGEHIQVWVANKRKFPAGDCRNALGLTAVTDAQARSYVHEFDTNIYPKESAAFSVPPNRNGASAPLAEALGLPKDYYQVPAAQADDITVLVDNVRDENFYDPASPDGQTWIGGFFSAFYNDSTNRNVMTIDAYDWLHRTGAVSADDSRVPAYAACSRTQRVARNRLIGLPHPRQYEGTFAHEYQHLLESYVDPDEVDWVNEGLSDYAESLVGYVDTNRPVDDPATDPHLRSFLGFYGDSFGGPENSLTLWGDQGGPEILADYGASFSFMAYLRDKYGLSFLTRLHREPANGLSGLDKVLAAVHADKDARGTVHDWAAAMALDEAASADPPRPSNAPFTAGTLRARVNWRSRQAFGTPGAPPNGSDYVRFRDASGKYLAADNLRRVSFAGATTLKPVRPKWARVARPPASSTKATTCGAVTHGSRNPALYSGCGDNLDRSIARPVSVPTGSPTLTFGALWDTEKGWDFGFVQVSVDGGRTWQSLPTASTTRAHDPDADPTVVANLPGFTGDSGRWRPQTADLSPWAGKKILLGFRYRTDSATAEAGFWVRRIKVGSTTLPSRLGGWRTYTQLHPDRVSGFTVQLVSIDRTSTRVHHQTLGISRRHLTGTLHGHSALVKAFGKRADLVGAIVTYDEPTESRPQYARYRLTVNGVVQPGG